MMRLVRVSFLFFVVLMTACVSWGQGKASKSISRYPYIKEVVGDVMLTLVNGEKKSARANDPLIEKATLQTAVGSEVVVQLDEERYFRLAAGSELLIPSISYESQQAPLLILKFGSLRWKTPYPHRGAYNVAISSDLFQFILPSGEYSLSMEPNKAIALVKVFEGKMEFSALNGEKSVFLNAGQKSGFQGVLEEGAIAYDVLLKGKRIPRGQLLPVESIDPLEVREFERQEKERAQAAQKAAQKVRTEKARLLKEGFICKFPTGKFNQCAWLAGDRNKPCIRLRCNANGEWAERTELSAEMARTQCRQKSFVGPCDY